MIVRDLKGQREIGKVKELFVLGNCDFIGRCVHPQNLWIINAHLEMVHLVIYVQDR